jgi:hypothetical protein
MSTITIWTQLLPNLSISTIHIYQRAQIKMKNSDTQHTYELLQKYPLNSPFYCKQNI